MNIFDHKNYREIITAYLAEQGSARGYQKSLATAAGCQPSYFSQMLKGQVQLTLDQAAGLAAVWQLDEEETEYLLTMVSLERSGSRHLKAILTRKLAKIRHNRQQLNSRLKEVAAVPEHGLLLFYSSWYYPAIHVLISIPRFANNEQAIAELLGISPALVGATLRGLVQMGLARRQANRWTVLQKSLHVTHDSPLYRTYHGNWRNIANRRMAEHPDANDINYTSLYAMSHQDFLKMREMVMNFIEETRKIVIPSAEEQLVCCLIDFFAID